MVFVFCALWNARKQMPNCLKCGQRCQHKQITHSIIINSHCNADLSACLPSISFTSWNKLWSAFAEMSQNHKLFVILIGWLENERASRECSFACAGWKLLNYAFANSRFRCRHSTARNYRLARNQRDLSIWWLRVASMTMCRRSVRFIWLANHSLNQLIFDARCCRSGSFYRRDFDFINSIIVIHTVECERRASAAIRNRWTEWNVFNCFARKKHEIPNLSCECVFVFPSSGRSIGISARAILGEFILCHVQFIARPFDESRLTARKIRNRLILPPTRTPGIQFWNHFHTATCRHFSVEIWNNLSTNYHHLLLLRSISILASNFAEIRSVSVSSCCSLLRRSLLSITRLESRM